MLCNVMLVELGEKRNVIHHSARSSNEVHVQALEKRVCNHRRASNVEHTQQQQVFLMQNQHKLIDQSCLAQPFHCHPIGKTDLSGEGIWPLRSSQHTSTDQVWSVVPHALKETNETILKSSKQQLAKVPNPSQGKWAVSPFKLWSPTAMFASSFA